MTFFSCTNDVNERPLWLLLLLIHLGIIISLSSLDKSFRQPRFLAWIWATAVEIPLTLMNVKNHISVTRMQLQHRKHCKGGLNMHSSAESCVSSCYLGVYPMVENAKKTLENVFWKLCMQHASTTQSYHFIWRLFFNAWLILQVTNQMYFHQSSSKCSGWFFL